MDAQLKLFYDFLKEKFGIPGTHQKDIGDDILYRTAIQIPGMTETSWQVELQLHNLNENNTQYGLRISYWDERGSHDFLEIATQHSKSTKSWLVDTPNGIDFNRQEKFADLAIFFKTCGIFFQENFDKTE